MTNVNIEANVPDSRASDHNHQKNQNHLYLENASQTVTDDLGFLQRVKMSVQV